MHKSGYSLIIPDNDRHVANSLTVADIKTASPKTPKECIAK